MGARSFVHSAGAKPVGPADETVRVERIPTSTDATTMLRLKPTIRLTLEIRLEPDPAAGRFGMALLRKCLESANYTSAVGALSDERGRVRGRYEDRPLPRQQNGVSRIGVGRALEVCLP